MNGAIGSHRFRSTAAASLETDTGDGGNVDEVFKRLGVIETTVTDLRLQVIAITTLLPNLATKAELASSKAEIKEDIHSVQTEVSAIKAVLPHLASKADVSALRGELKADMHTMEAAIIKWIVGTAIASAAVASAIASVVAMFVS